MRVLRSSKSLFIALALVLVLVPLALFFYFYVRGSVESPIDAPILERAREVVQQNTPVQTTIQNQSQDYSVEIGSNKKMNFVMDHFKEKLKREGITSVELVMSSEVQNMSTSYEGENEPIHSYAITETGNKLVITVHFNKYQLDKYNWGEESILNELERYFYRGIHLIGTTTGDETASREAVKFYESTATIYEDNLFTFQ